VWRVAWYHVMRGSLQAVKTAQNLYRYAFHVRGQLPPLESQPTELCRAVEGAKQPHPPGLNRQVAWNASVYLSVGAAAELRLAEHHPSVRWFGYARSLFRSSLRISSSVESIARSFT
jgi:hypothetical protein